MPEIKHQFSSGRMNLDLDERLVPNGEYKEAFNIQVSSSEGSNVGVLQNLLSNQEVKGQSGGVRNKLFTYSCIGSVSDEKNDTLYWFVKPDWYTPSPGFQIFSGAYNQNPQFDWTPVNKLWQWKENDIIPPIPGSHKQIVQTTIGRDMILQYNKETGVVPVLIDNFEVICGVVDGNVGLPSVDPITTAPIEHGVMSLQIDRTAWESINNGWVLSGYAVGQDFKGSSPQLITLNDVVVSKKYFDVNRYFIELSYNPSPYVLSAGLDFKGLRDNIASKGIGPTGHVKALYFRNPKSVRHITGINIIDDMLFWTDDYNEPKKINIPRCIEGNYPFNLQYPTFLINDALKISLSDHVSLKEEHVTVIKKSPNNPPALELVTGREETRILEDGQLYYKSYSSIITTGGMPGYQTDDIVDINGNTNIQTFSSLKVGDQFTVKISRDTSGHDVNTGGGILFNWGIGDEMVLKEFDDLNIDPPSLPLTDYTIKANLDSVSATLVPNVGYVSIPGSIMQVTLTVTSIRGVPPTASTAAGNTTGELQYVLDKFDQDKNIFEFKYPRFGYRYKYEDGEYSHFSPFTQPAFVPGGFDYHPKKGYNLAMANRIEHVIVKNYVPDNIPLDVVAIDILYKDDLSPDDEKKITKPYWCHEPLDHDIFAVNYNYWQLNAYIITDEQIKYILPENQLLRIYDNVPKKALAQDVTGNRIVYGNYLQNFDLLNSKGNKFYPEFYSFVRDDKDSSDNERDRSTKSLREYQLGVVFIDEFGRETPVLSSRIATFKVPKATAAKNNRLVVGMKFEPPAGHFAKMEHFKFCIKETSGQWYNMAMDRWYDAADGNIWMSFPSADRDKLIIDDFLILKKAAETNTPVLAHPARYKVLAIENEAPDYIKRTFTLIDYRSHNNIVFNTGTSDIPRSGVSTFELQFSTFYNTHVSNLHEQFLNKGLDDFYVQFEESEETSKRYKISSITSDIQYDLTTGNPTNLGSAKYYIKTSEVFSDDVNVILDDPTGITATTVLLTAKMRLFRMKPENKPEFDGRFFVKIFSDDIFEQYVKSNYNPSEDTEYVVSASIKLSYMNHQHHLMHEGDSSWKDESGTPKSYHAGTGFPVGKIPTPVKSPWELVATGVDTNKTSYWTWMDNAYSAARYTGRVDSDGYDVRLGLRHFAPYFRKYTQATDHGQTDPMEISVPDVTWTSGGEPGFFTQYHMPNNNTDSAAGLVGDIFSMDDFDPLYKFEYGSGGNDTRWREEYNDYTTIPHKSFYPIKYLGNYGSSPFRDVGGASNYDAADPIPWQQNSPLDAPYNVPESQLLWDNWWRTDGYNKKSDNLARDTEVWYINNGFTMGKEYYTNNKIMGSGTYGPQQGNGLSIGSTQISLEISLGGLWGEPKASMDGITGAMNDPDFFAIGKANGNPSYQDIPTMDIVSSMVPGSFCKFKEDPGANIYQIIGVTESNHFNYSVYEKDDEGDWYLQQIANEAGYGGAGGIEQKFTGEWWTGGGGTYGPILDINTNYWDGDLWGKEEPSTTYGTYIFDYDGHINGMKAEIGLPLSSAYTGLTAHTYDPSTSAVILGSHQGYISWTKNQSHGSQLSCNFSKSWKLKLHNITASNTNDVPWDPTGTTGVYYGPITNGVEIDITITGGNDANGTTDHVDLDVNKYTFVTSSITNSTTGHVLKKGMIVVSYDSNSDGTFDVNFGKNITSDSDHSSLLYLQVIDITVIDSGGVTAYRVELGGYMRPLTVNDTYDFEDGKTLKFQQAIMNGYSPNSVYKIAANTKFSGDFDTGAVGGTLEATEYTLQFLKPLEEKEIPLSTNPAIWETEPKDGPDLDIYYEASPRIPIELNTNNANDWIPTRYSNDPDLVYSSYPEDNGQSIHNPHGSYENSIILTGDPVDGFAFMPPEIITPLTKLEIVHVEGDILTLRCDGKAWRDAIIFSVMEIGTSTELVSATSPAKTIEIRRPDGIKFSAKVLAHNVANTNTTSGGLGNPSHYITPGGLEPYVDRTDPSFGVGAERSFRIKIDKNLYGGGDKDPNCLIELDWHNCYSFRNGVESDRIRDNFNTPFISNGVRVSTTLSDYEQERRQYGLIYSGIYNSTSGINNLNQFIQAEKITKDINPEYGSIQKLHSRDSDLVTLCEDKTLKILANKDAVYNADGNPQLTANINVLGQTVPFSGNYGISKNPESFASENYRAYFTEIGRASCRERV